MVEHMLQDVMLCLDSIQAECKVEWLLLEAFDYCFGDFLVGETSACQILLEELFEGTVETEQAMTLHLLKENALKAVTVHDCLDGLRTKLSAGSQGNQPLHQLVRKQMMILV